MSDFSERQANRQRRILELEEQADYLHRQLVGMWKLGHHDTDLLARDRHAHTELLEARKEYEIGLKAKP